MSIPEPKKTPFTELQGQYLAFIYAYTKLNARAPSEADMQRYFAVTAPSVHRMVLALEQAGFITRHPGRARSIALLADPQMLPVLR